MILYTKLFYMILLINSYIKAKLIIIKTIAILIKITSKKSNSVSNIPSPAISLTIIMILHLNNMILLMTSSRTIILLYLIAICTNLILWKFPTKLFRDNFPVIFLFIVFFLNLIRICIILILIKLNIFKIPFFNRKILLIINNLDYFYIN